MKAEVGVPGLVCLSALTTLVGIVRAAPRRRSTIRIVVPALLVAVAGAAARGWPLAVPVLVAIALAGVVAGVFFHSRSVRARNPSIRGAEVFRF